jgi:hypothetical protein
MAVAAARAGTPGKPTLDSLSCAGRLPLRVDSAGRASLVQTVHDLAAEGYDAKAPGSVRLLARFRENARRLAAAHRRLSVLTAAGEPVPAESEWLLDNYYVVGEVVREVRTDLPRGYYRELPAISVGPLAGLPRVYPLAAALLTYSDSALTEAAIRDAVKVYQDVVPLSTGELWALPTMLRLALLENLRRLADQILATIDDRRSAAAAVAAARTGRSRPSRTSRPTRSPPGSRTPSARPARGRVRPARASGGGPPATPPTWVTSSTGSSVGRRRTRCRSAIRSPASG